HAAPLRPAESAKTAPQRARRGRRHSSSLASTRPAHLSLPLTPAETTVAGFKATSTRHKAEICYMACFERTMFKTAKGLRERRGPTRVVAAANPVGAPAPAGGAGGVRACVEALA